MTLLLDSHAVLWWLQGDSRLPQKAQDMLLDTGNAAWASAASFWELSIKTSIGKLRLPADWIGQLRKRMDEDAVDYLHVLPAHCEAVQNMAFHHKDPFDRMLAAQAERERLTIISRDAIFDRYGIARIW